MKVHDGISELSLILLMLLSTCPIPAFDGRVLGSPWRVVTLPGSSLLAIRSSGHFSQHFSPLLSLKVFFEARSHET